MRVTRDNVDQLVVQGILPTGDLSFHIRSGAEALPLPPMFKANVRWQPEDSELNAVVTKISDTLPPITFFEWNELDVEQHEDGWTLSFVAQSPHASTPVRIAVERERVQQA